MQIKTNAEHLMNLLDLFAHRVKRIDQKDPLLALDELIDFQQLVDVVEAIAPRKKSRNKPFAHYRGEKSR